MELDTLFKKLPEHLQHELSKRKSIMDMTIDEFKALPFRSGSDGWGWSREVLCDSLVILPTGILHDSGYQMMDFVAIVSTIPICKLSGCSDVVHINGIGGYGYDWLTRFGTVPKTLPPQSWCFDCLPCGLLRIFLHEWKEILCGAALSSFEIYSTKEVEE